MTSPLTALLAACADLPGRRVMYPIGSSPPSRASSTDLQLADLNQRCPATERRDGCYDCTSTKPADAEQGRASARLSNTLKSRRGLLMDTTVA